MAEQLISITIRPTQEEFSGIKIPMDQFILYMMPNEYIVSLECGQKKGAFNHYQIAYRSSKHVDTIRRAINRFFKPHLTPSTLKKGKWRKCLKHNNKHSLLGYCQKEGNVYSTNIEQSKLKAELELYNSQKTIKKAKPVWPKCRRCLTPLLSQRPTYANNGWAIDYSYYNYFCKKCNCQKFPIF